MIQVRLSFHDLVHDKGAISVKNASHTAGNWHEIIAKYATDIKQLIICRILVAHTFLNIYKKTKNHAHKNKSIRLSKILYDFSR